MNDAENNDRIRRNPGSHQRNGHRDRDQFYAALKIGAGKLRADSGNKIPYKRRQIRGFRPSARFWGAMQKALERTVTMHDQTKEFPLFKIFMMICVLTYFITA